MITLTALCLLFLVSPCYCWYPRVLTPQGPITGRTDVSRNGRYFFMFDGIPYAKPPTGELRFKPPEPLEPWKEDFDAIRAQTICIQSNLGHRIGTEDCLVLNVYTPSLTHWGSLMSVIVFIHGGNFDFWTSARLIAGGPEFFMDEDIVLVTLNYRLGIMGFLSTEDEAAPGNYGLLDQRLALQWIQENIESFGGNPNSVTLVGISAGAASIHLHMASPLSKDLFHKAVMQSGTAFSGFCRGSSHRESVRDIAWLLDCPVESSFAMVDCLREKGEDELIDALEQWKADNEAKGERFLELPHPWTPRVDMEADTPFLPKHPYELFSAGDYSQIPCIVGNSKDEFIFDEAFPLKVRNDFKRLKTEWPRICKIMIDDNDAKKIPEEELRNVCNKIYQRYLRDFDGKNMDKVTKLFTYGGILHGVYKAVKMMVQHDHPIYYYSMDHYREDQSVLQVFSFSFRNTKGAVHANDLIYLFTYPMIGLDANEATISHNYVSFLVSFANTGEPTYPQLGVKWLPTGPPDYQHLRIDDDSYMTEKVKDEHFEFWEEIFHQIADSYKILRDEL